MTGVRVVNANWEKERVALKQIREQVFVKEQNVHKELEWDGLDGQALHFIAFKDEQAVGCARLLENKKISRMAVLKEYRNQGIGRQIIDHIKRYASQKRYTLLQLSAQCHAFEFYRQSGFNAHSSPYEDADIPHINMECRVFSQDSGLDYTTNQDTKLYHGIHPIEALGYLDIMLSQCKRTLTLCISDLSHPLCRNPSLLRKIQLLARKNRHFKTHILIGQYQPSYNDHTLFKMMNRLSSFVEIRTCKDSINNHWVIDDTAWFEFDGNESRACYSDRARTKHFMERFNRWWHHAKVIQGARHLSI